MQNKNALNLFVSIMLSMTIAFANVPLYAQSMSNPNISNAQHKQIIEQFLSEIKAIQSQVADIAISALKDPTAENIQRQRRINYINNNIERLNKAMQDYLATVPNVGERNRHVLLAFNVLNLTKSSLYTLSQLINTNNDAERFDLLEEYFHSRVTALDILQILEEILSEYNA